MSTQTAWPKYLLLGVEVDALTIDQAVDYLARLVLKSGSHYVVKPYVEFLATAAHQPHLQTLLNQAVLCLPDGIALNWAAYYLHGGQPSLGRLFRTLAEIIWHPGRMSSMLPERFGGLNFTLALLQTCTRRGLSVYLIGSPQDGSIKQTAQFVGAKFPGLKLAGYYGGRLTPALEKGLLAELSRKQPDIILVGMGFPRQEELMAKLAARLNHGVFIGEGGSFDYADLGGKKLRAPRFWQRIGLEWLWRLLLEPRRWRRQLAIPRFIRLVYQEGKHPKGETL